MMSSKPDTRPRLLLVDDEPANLQVLRQVLQDDYRLLFARDGHKALELARSEAPALILLDVMMPELSGLDVCRTLKSQDLTAAIPVIFVTALADVMNETQGFEAGAVDYISKPISPAIVRARVRTHLQLVRVESLRQTRLQIVLCLGRASEYKDNETGWHVLRMSHYSRILALAAGFDDAAAEDLMHAAPMHDVGKIGIPDAVLQKPGPLDEREWEIMKRHPLIGAEILGQHQSGLLAMAQRIAVAHHEKWDGSGYPNGVAGEDIPIEARIISIADVFDALTSVRPYKDAWPVEKAVEHLRAQAGKHFDPRLIELFIEELPAILEVRGRFLEAG